MFWLAQLGPPTRFSGMVALPLTIQQGQIGHLARRRPFFFRLSPFGITHFLAAHLAHALDDSPWHS